ncbi:MAG TPA: hypothetical protein VKB69_12080 [Micromonosporaceae bacterium]|nr:hypothetical protein [Micromonosporaceae bacterium]
MSDPVLSATRQALHAVAELLLAGPQFRRSGTIRLRPAPGGFGTVAAPDLAVDGSHLVAGTGRFVLSGSTLDELARQAGVDAGAPGIYHDGSGAAPGDHVSVDERAAAHLATCYAAGEAALRRLAPGETPVLWPEHFDLGITLDEVNYGVSPGDGWLDEPYAYVGPWQRRTGTFWTAPFGAARPLRELADAAVLADFFAEGRARAGTDPVAPAGEETASGG